MTPIVVAHEPGGNGDAWRSALRSWPADSYAPDLVITTAIGDRTDVVWLLLEQLETWRAEQPIIIGCGEHSLAAETFALAGWVGGLVLVDGLGGAWTSVQQQVAAQNAWLRAKADDPDLVGYAEVWLERFTAVLRSNVACRVLVIETPASITPAGEAALRIEQFAADATLVELSSADPSVVLDAVRTWWT